MEKNDFKYWKWFAWTEWYTMAIVFAELCKHTEGPLVEWAWLIAEANFAKHKALIRDSVLWGKPR